MTEQLCPDHKDPYIWFSVASQANKLPAITSLSEVSTIPSQFNITHVCTLYKPSFKEI